MVVFHPFVLCWEVDSTVFPKRQLDDGKNNFTPALASSEEGTPITVALCRLARPVNEKVGLGFN